MMCDASTEKYDLIRVTGKHEIERIPNPLGCNNSWLVLKGTKIGGSENFLRRFKKGFWRGEFEVIIEE